MKRALFFKREPKQGEVTLFIKTEENGSLGLFTSDGKKVLGTRCISLHSKFDEVTTADVELLPTAPPLEE